MKLYLWIFFLSLCLSLQAQVPGYQGRHFLLEATPIMEYRSLNPFKNRFPCKIRLEYALTRHFGLSAFSDLGVFKGTEKSWFPSSATYQDYKTLTTMYSIGGELRYYACFSGDRGFGITPLGFYMGFYINDNKGTVRLLDTTGLDFNKVKGGYLATGFSFGERSIIAHRVTLDYGMYIDVMSATYRRQGELTPIEGAFLNRLKGNYQSPLMVRAYLGVGYFIF